jgi:DNA-directed RNA polymerase subunit M/transcription elongation factor TFIIS
MLRIDRVDVEVAPDDELAHETATCPACGHQDALPLQVITLARHCPTWLVSYRCDECAHEWRARQETPPWAMP